MEGVDGTATVEELRQEPGQLHVAAALPLGRRVSASSSAAEHALVVPLAGARLELYLLAEAAAFQRSALLWVCLLVWLCASACECVLGDGE